MLWHHATMPGLGLSQGVHPNSSARGGVYVGVMAWCTPQRHAAAWRALLYTATPVAVTSWLRLLLCRVAQGTRDW